MPEASQIIRMRERRRSRPKTGISLSLGISGFLSLGVSFLLLLSSLAYVAFIADLPSPDALVSLMDAERGLLIHPTQLLDRSGEYVVATLRHPAAASATYLFVPNDLFSSDQHIPISPRDKSDPSFSWEIIFVTIATADPSFWQHSGFTLASLGKDNNKTLAQQLVAEFLLWEEPAGMRKVLRGNFLAAQITNRFGRAQILEWYLNSAQYGHLIYGADAAAHVYFGKSATDLNISEAVWLAALAQNPNLPPTQDDFKQLLKDVQTSGFMSQVALDQAQMPEPLIDPTKRVIDSFAPGFSEYTLARLGEIYNLNRIQRGGLRITTSLNTTWQLQATCATFAHLERSGTPVEKSSLPKDLDCQAERLLSTLSGPAGSPAGQLAANVVILDPTNGQILAYVGDPNSNLDPASLPGHPPGSLLTPFIYLTSFTRGFTPASLVWDITSEEVLAEIDNRDPQEHGPMRLRIAMANDYLVPAAQIMNRVGSENIQRTIQQFGLSSNLNEVNGLPVNIDQTILLDGGDVTLLEVVQAMGVLANQGVASGSLKSSPEVTRDPNSEVEPVVVLDIQDLDGRPWDQIAASRNQPILSTQLAYLITNILSDEAARWPALGHPNALEIGRPAAAKLGSTAAGKDVWTIGYTPQMVVGVWIGRISSEIESPLSTQLPAALWHALMQFAHRELPSQGWTKPNGITSLEVCDPSGLLPSSNCPTLVNEIFISGTEPIQMDNLYRAVQINRETGLLATIYTPSDLVEEKIYLQVPPEAISWANQAGIVTPPNLYDLVTSAAQNDPDVMITSPGMYSVVGGQVSITGTAAGEGFSRYRIQIGQGLNPTSWLQVGDDSLKPIHNAELLKWETQELSGLYTLQLLVERTDRTVHTSTIQVSIDNQAPEVAILYPQAGQVIDLSTITIQTELEDDLRLAFVRILVDDRLIAQLDQSPFTAIWQTQTGDHLLTVEATDQAGNLSTASIPFTVR